MIVVEGPDGAGKSTLIRKLVERWDLPVADRVVGKDTKATIDVAAWVEDNVRMGWQPQIFDRHRLISEPIYGPILRGTNQDPHFLDYEWVWEQLNIFYTSQPIIIYCLPLFRTVRHNVNFDPENDNSAVAGMIRPIYSAYATRAAIDSSLRPGTTSLYDYTKGESIDALVARWDRVIEARRKW